MVKHLISQIYLRDNMILTKHKPKLSLSLSLPLSPRVSHLLLTLLLQVQLDLQGLPCLQEGLAMLTVGHVVGHHPHRDGT